MRWLRKVEDFRLLPLFVVVSMAIGIGIGKAFGISRFKLTPPIDAIKAIFTGTYDFNLANILALGVVIGLFLMMYPAMTNVRLEDLGRAFESPKQLLLVVFSNFAVCLFAMIYPIMVRTEDAGRGLRLREQSLWGSSYNSGGHHA